MGPRRVKAKNRLSDRGAEASRLNIDLFENVAAEIAQAVSIAQSASMTGDAKAARLELFGGDRLDILGSINRLNTAALLKEQIVILQKIKSDFKEILQRPSDNESSDVQKVFR